MSENNTETILQTEVEKLPGNIKKYLADKRLRSDVDSVAEKYGLNNNQKEILEKEVFFILLGADFIEDFDDNLSEVITEKEVRSNIKSSFTEILKVFEGDIKSIHERHEKEEASEVGTQPDPTPKPEDPPKPDYAQEEKTNPEIPADEFTQEQIPPANNPLTYSDNSSEEAFGEENSIEKERSNIMKIIEEKDSTPNN